MAEEMSLQTCNMAAEKRSKRKRQTRRSVTHLPPDGHLISGTPNMKPDTSFGSICISMGSLTESSDAGTLYLNPQTPNWSLVEKFAELSPGEETEITNDRDDNRELLKCTKYTETNTMHEPNEVLLDAVNKKGKKGLINQNDVSAKNRTSKLKELNVEDFSPNRGEKKAKKNVSTHTGLKPHVCDICGKAYSHQGTLQQHKRLHTGERPYHCPFCVKTYIWSSDYRKHIRTHTGEKPYICDTCGKDFIRSSDLRKHERNMHTNDKPFPCTHCGKTFNKPLSLKRHERKHLGERPFSCPDCGKSFALASRMAEHQKIHTGVRPYICSVCAKCFTKSSNLTEHEAIHSGVRPHKCEECGVAFCATKLSEHMLQHRDESWEVP
uniref:Zinc finger protein 648 n=1 Tax=Acanthochromis polyacanthus TaxID=80966 RepID=A0A3Q1GGG0_9TELE